MFLNSGGGGPATAHRCSTVLGWAGLLAALSLG